MSSGFVAAMQPSNHGDAASSDKKEVVVLSQVLSDEANIGFTFDSVGLDYVKTINGAPVADMHRFVAAIKKSIKAGDEFIKLEVTRGNVPTSWSWRPPSSSRRTRPSGTGTRYPCATAPTLKTCTIVFDILLLI